MIIFPMRKKGAVMWDDAQHKRLPLLLLSSPRFWEMEVLPQGVFDNVKRDGERQEGSNLIPSKTIGYSPKHSRSRIKPQGAEELSFKPQDPSNDSRKCVKYQCRL